MNFEYITQASPAIQIHLVTALAALVFGTIMWLRPKGTKSHKFMGRAFIMMMVVTAISAYFIRTLANGSFSWIHIFVPITLIGSWQVVSSIRKGHIKKHKAHVRNMFFAALMIPGAFSFMPGRTMWMLFFG
ncbi:DUF2306 domain-containing protein [Fretibacter rubidus]|uniref:DUF2306 domain-containing protein n=1 Tax=Fretibacter rubidus TaxID=570162 RepID=UPI003529FCF6